MKLYGIKYESKNGNGDPVKRVVVFEDAEEAFEFLDKCESMGYAPIMEPFELDED